MLVNKDFTQCCECAKVEYADIACKLPDEDGAYTRFAQLVGE